MNIKKGNSSNVGINSINDQKQTFDKPSFIIDKIKEGSVKNVFKILGASEISYLFKYGRRLSQKEEINRSLFFNNGFEGTVRQGEVGTCYFLASLEMMKATRIGKLNLLNIIESANINGQESYNVKFPGYDKVINITKKELDLVKSKGYGLKKGSLGDHIISVAHMKYMYETKSDKFIIKNISFEDYINNHIREKYADMVFERGQEEQAIKLLMGDKNIIVDYFYLLKDGLGFNHGEMFLPPKGLAKTSNIMSFEDLSRFFNEGAMIGVGTKKKKIPGNNSEKEVGVEYDDYYGKKVTILGPHAHWIRKIDIKAGFVDISEPFNSNKIIRFTLKQFSSIFNSITLVRKRKEFI